VSDIDALADAAAAVGGSAGAEQFAATAGLDGPSVISSASSHVSHAPLPPSSSQISFRRQGSREEQSSAPASSTSSLPPPPFKGKPEHIIELQELPSADDASDLQSLLSSHLTRDYTKLESTQINESNILRSGDRLIISAKLENLQHLRHMKGKGLSIGDSVINSFHDVDSEFVELVVSHRCPHLGKAINSRCGVLSQDWFSGLECDSCAGTSAWHTISRELLGRGGTASACLRCWQTPSLP